MLRNTAILFYSIRINNEGQILFRRVNLLCISDDNIAVTTLNEESLHANTYKILVSVD